MRCKPNELAIVVDCGDYAKKSLGKVVRVTTLYPHNLAGIGPAWAYEPPLLMADDGVRHIDAINDDCLRPLRDGEGDDETLTWAGKPTEEQDRLWAEFDSAMSELEKRLA